MVPRAPTEGWWAYRARDHTKRNSRSKGSEQGGAPKAVKTGGRRRWLVRMRQDLQQQLKEDRRQRSGSEVSGDEDG